MSDEIAVHKLTCRRFPKGDDYAKEKWELQVHLKESLLPEQDMGIDRLLLPKLTCENFKLRVDHQQQEPIPESYEYSFEVTANGDYSRVVEVVGTVTFKIPVYENDPPTPRSRQGATWVYIEHDDYEHSFYLGYMTHGSWGDLKITGKYEEAEPSDAGEES